jgi:hypothetical protein
MVVRVTRGDHWFDIDVRYFIFYAGAQWEATVVGNYGSSPISKPRKGAGVTIESAVKDALRHWDASLPGVLEKTG